MRSRRPAVRVHPTPPIGPTDRPKDSNQRVRLAESQTRQETPHPSSLTCGTGSRRSSASTITVWSVSSSGLTLPISVTLPLPDIPVRAVSEIEGLLPRGHKRRGRHARQARRRTAVLNIDADLAESETGDR
jgi:hypothetical protein